MNYMIKINFYRQLEILKIIAAVFRYSILSF